MKLEDEVTPNSEDRSEKQLYFLEELEPVIQITAHMASQMMAVSDLSAGATDPAQGDSVHPLQEVCAFSEYKKMLQR